MVKKKTRKKATKKKPARTATVRDCNLSGVTVNWDADGVEAVVSIARALECNASALGQLARVIQSDGITVGPCINFE